MKNLATPENLSKPLRNQHGGVIGVILVILALIGGWYIYQSYTAGHLKSNLKSITGDYKSGIQKIIPGK